MPLHWRKRWQRGFNQSDLLAREIAGARTSRCGMRLRRVKNTAAQAGLTNAKRRGNVAGAFRAKAAIALRGKQRSADRRCDDHRRHRGACARALKRAGAARGHAADAGARGPAHRCSTN